MRDFVKAFCQAARQAGMEKLNFYIREEKKRDISVYEDALEHLERSELNQLYIQALVDGKMGSIFVENFDLDTIPELLRSLQEDAELCSHAFVPYDLERIQTDPQEFDEFTDLNSTVDALSAACKAACDADSRILSGIEAHVGENRCRITLANEQLQYVSDLQSSGSAGFRLVAQEGEQVQSGGKGVPFAGRTLPDLSSVARQAALDASSALGAGTYTTGSIPVVLDSNVVGELLDAFMPAFFGRNVVSRMSVLADKLGAQIAGENISILEDPSLPGGFSIRRFDDEGEPTQAKTIVDRGTLTCFLHNRKSAHQQNCQPGGNGFKPDFHEEPATGYTNVYIPAGDKSREELLKTVGNGLLITHVSGVFAGARPNSGDFSLISSGCRIENGRLGRAVTQITIAGNFFDMLRQVTAIGNDEHWKCTAIGCIRTPSLAVGSLMISGKE